MMHEEFELGASDAAPGTKGNVLVGERAVREGDAPDITLHAADEWELDEEDDTGKAHSGPSGSGSAAADS
jgi:hypothetical protein